MRKRYKITSTSGRFDFPPIGHKIQEGMIVVWDDNKLMDFIRLCGELAIVYPDQPIQEYAKLEIYDDYRE